MTNLGDLEVFVRVIAAGSMSTAARDLGLSPAVVSKRIKRLEDKLGTRLLQRTTRQISLTEAGQGFHERVLTVLGGLEEAEAFAHKLLQQLRIPLTSINAFNSNSVSASIGICMFPYPHATAIDVVRRADQAMYHVKRMSKDGIAVAAMD